MSEVMAELFNGPISPNDASVTNVALGKDVASATLGARKPLVVELDVFAGLGHNARGTNQHVVVNHLLGELNISGRTHDS